MKRDNPIATLEESSLLSDRMDVNYTLDLLNRDDDERGHIVNELARIKNEYAITNCTVLDLGCGTGRNLEVFKNDNRTLGIEGLASAAKLARSRGLDVQQANLEEPIR